MSTWISHFSTSHPVPFTILALSVACFVGILLGNIQFKGLSMGIAGVLFSSLILGHFGATPNAHILEFVRDFGLVLFVYAIGIKVGPGFFRSLRKRGLVLNILAVTIVLSGAAIAVLISKVLGVDIVAAVGIFSGATTNTPSLGATQETLKTLAIVGDRAALPTLGYAVCYPFGIIGIILVMMILRALRRVNLEDDIAEVTEQDKLAATLERRNVELSNIPAEGINAEQIALKYQITISRILMPQASSPIVATHATVLTPGAVVLAVGTPDKLDAFVSVIGHRSSKDLMSMPGPVVFRRMVVTREDLTGKSLGELRLEYGDDVTITRVQRQDIEIVAHPQLKLQFGDVIQAVGHEENLARVERVIGNSKEALNHLNLVPVFIGITIGVLIGMIPVPVPGVPSPIKLGLAGGSLVTALIFGHFGCIGRMSWTMPAAANNAIKDLGITLFLAAVGLKAGGRFIETLMDGAGLLWMGCGAIITFVPLFLVGLFASIVLKMNFVRICGLVSGSMTDPPALSFATSMTKSDTPVISYATVYPITMICRIIVVQIILLVFE